MIISIDLYVHQYYLIKSINSLLNLSILVSWVLWVSY